MSLSNTINVLGELLGDRLSRSDDDRASHAKDVCHHPASPPDAVAFPESTEEVARVLAVCQENHVPVIPFGTGTGVEGGVVAVRGGIAVDTGRMNAILRISERDMDCSVEAGVTRFQLNDALRSLGLFFPVDPGADASLGGMAATCASGSAAVKYGTMRDNVLGATAVTIDGRVFRTGGRARKSSAGYDLTRLLVGSEGTLAVITELTLKLHRIPQSVVSAACAFPSVPAAVDAAIAVMQDGVDVARLELLDTTLIAAVNRYSGLQQEVAPSLLMEFHGSQSEHVRSAAKQAESISDRFGGQGFRWAEDESQRKVIWQARYDSYYACLALREGGIGYVSDVCVPITNLAKCIQYAQDLVDTCHLPTRPPIFGHVGDGNFHVVMLIRPDDAEELREAQRINRLLVERALELDGTCTGEHGIGLGKLDALRAEFGDAVDLMADLKRAWDPLGLLNPGKVLQPKS